MRSTLSCFLFTALLPLYAQNGTPAKAVVEGDVVDATTNAPIAGARLKLTARQENVIYSKADKQGHFAISNLTPGLYELSVESSGFLHPPTASIDARLVQAASARSSNITSVVYVYPPSKIPPAQLKRSADADGTVRVTVTLPLLAYATITGKVTNASGLPMMDCNIELFRKRPAPPPGMPGRTGPFLNGNDEFESVPHNGDIGIEDCGEFRVARLEPGRYWLAVNKGSSASRSWESSDRITYFPAATDIDAAEPIEVVAGQTLRADVQIVRKPGVRVAGRLIGPPGVPDSVLSLPGAGPRPTHITLEPKRNVFVNANGPFTTGREDFEFNDVLPGQYMLIALMWDSKNDSLGPNQKNFGLVRDVEIANRDLVGLDLELEPLKNLPGEVTFGSGCTPGTVEIRAQSSISVNWGQITAVSESDGKFVLSGPLVGRAHLNVTWRSLPGPSPRVSSIRLGSQDLQKEDLLLPYLGTDTLHIAIECGGGRRP
jgi:hypothetical protein